MSMRTHAMLIVMKDRIPCQLHQYRTHLGQCAPPLVQPRARNAATERGIDRRPPGSNMNGTIGHRLPTTFQCTNTLSQRRTYGAALLDAFGWK
jgi:hypothetical protein